MSQHKSEERPPGQGAHDAPAQGTTLSLLTRCCAGVAAVSVIRAQDRDTWLKLACDTLRRVFSPPVCVLAWEARSVAAPPGWVTEAVGVAGAQSQTAAQALIQELRAGAPSDDVATIAGQRKPRPERVVAARPDLCPDELWARSTLRAFRAAHGLHEFARALLPYDCDEGPRALAVEVSALDAAWRPGADTVDALSAVAPHVFHAYRAAFVEPDQRRRELLARLTEIQQVIAPMLADGHTEHAIAESMQRSRHTIHDHAKRIYKSWGVNSRFELRELWLGAGERQPRSTRDHD